MTDGRNFNEMMIKEGYAYEYTYNKPYKYQDQFKEAEGQAREEEVGLWGRCIN
jgi:micrococcal nuclease